METLQIKSRPSVIFGSNEQYIARSEKLIRRLMKVSDSGTISELDIEELRNFQEAFKALVLYPALQETLVQELATMPSVAFDVITGDYTANSPYLETTIYSSPELIYRLLVWSAETSTPLRYPINFYSQLLLEDVIWAIRWNRAYNNEQYQYSILDFVEENRFSEAGSACLYLQLNPKEDAEPYTQAITSHWKYALLAAVLFKDRGINIKILQQESILYPQWAYHFLEFVPETNKETAIQTLLASPAWLAEYLDNRPLSEIKDIGAKALIGKNLNPLWPDFEIWFNKKCG